MRRGPLALLLLSLSGWAAQPTVAIDLLRLDEATFRELDAVLLEKTATVRLVQEGFAVVATAAQPTVVVRVFARASPRRVMLEATGPGGTAAGEVSWGAEPLPELHLEVVQKLVALARATATRKPEPPPPPPPPAGPPVSSPAAPPVPPLWSVSAAGGVLARGGGVDPLGLISVRRGEFLLLGLELGGTGGHAGGVSVLEAYLAAGPALAFEPITHLRLEVGVVAGALLHDFWLDDPTAATPSGVRVDFFAAAPLSATFAWPTTNLSLGVRLAPGWSPGHTHVRDGATLWQRGALLAQAAVQLTWRP